MKNIFIGLCYCYTKTSTEDFKSIKSKHINETNRYEITKKSFGVEDDRGIDI
jgi:hypothetical protein